jgi:hypothetical protein
MVMRELGSLGKIAAISERMCPRRRIVSERGICRGWERRTGLLIA